MKASKGNKVYSISETQKKSYLEAGYDITGDNGKVIATGIGKTVPYEDYEKALTENAALKEEVKKAKEEAKKAKAGGDKKADNKNADKVPDEEAKE